ncbi:hypothetical protein L5515_001853 [Caenorhabditis briggsae]|uniref:Protein kinase domain-containing protein n=2 Tax=Caenorhabditis briggsae TaxID=6238 RepID=A0AAE9J433_CAEBR|nr:hypothetical protein L5515_001853 [Caenorhabditis briggsae]
MTLVESKSNVEITKRSMSDDEEIKDALFVNVSIPFIENFVLKNPGDFCVSTNLEGILYLSIVAHPNKTKKEGPRVINLRIEQSGKEYVIPGLIFARASSMGKLIYQLKNENIDILCGVLDENLSMDCLLGQSSTVMHNIHLTDKLITNQKSLYRDIQTMIYTGEMKFADGKIKEAIFEQILHCRPGSTDHKVFFEKIVNGKALSNKNLPIRLPIGAILTPPTLIYENKVELGSLLESFLKTRQSELDLTQRIKFCSSAVRILSELHQCDIYHGASQMENFYVEFAGFKPKTMKNYELVFSGANGLLIQGKSDNTVHVVDYDSTAPEVAFTRKLTKESGVFNLGRLFEQILKPDLIQSYKEESEEPRALNEMRHLISRTTHPNPTRRPTMHGVVMMIRDILQKNTQSTSPINIVHFDQFTKN